MEDGDKKIFGQELINQAGTFVANLNGSAIPELGENRKQALNFLKDSGFPGPKAEDYKFTKLTRAISGKFDLSTSSKIDQIPEDLVADICKRHEGANVLFFINGKFNESYSVIVTKAEDLKILSLKDYAKNNELTALLNENSDAFAMQNSVYANDGVVVEVTKNKVVAEPIICYYLTVNDDNANHGFLKNVYVCNENCQVDIVHFHESIGSDNSFINESKNYIVKQNAKVTLYKVQEESPKAVYVGNTHVYQERDSVFTSMVFTLDGEVVRNNLRIEVAGEGCESNMFGLYLIKGKTHVDNHTVIDHTEPNCNSNELYKGVMDDEARGVFNGKIYVRQAAQKTNAFQSNTNILLTDRAVINAKPQLEIWADDVKCSHGCTTGQLDENAIFYLRARGIGKEKARSMVLLANVSEVIEKIKLGWLKVEITNKVINRLGI
jgi:Fe-S cluster assembly protein SufD